MVKAFEDMVVGDFAGLQVEEIAAIIAAAPITNPSPRDIFEKACRIAANLKRETNNFNL